MNKIQKLIEELCPEGVVYKTLGELGEFMGGLTGKSKEDFFDGNAIFITYKNVYSNPALDVEPSDRVKIAEGEKQRTLEYGDVIFTGSSETPDECGISSVVTKYPIEKLYLNSFCFVFRFNNLSIIDPHFAQHLFRSHDLRCQISKTAAGVTRFNVSKDKMKNVIIPLPPMEIQQEIVRILDKFTELEVGLQEELEVRKQQFTYVKDKLLDFENTDVPKVSIKEICNNVFSGKNKERLEDGQYPVYGSTGIISSTNTAVYNKKQILIARVGANAGYVHIADGQYDVSDNTLIVDVKDGISLMYIYYQMVYMNLHKYAKGGGQPLVTAGQIKNLTIPLPSLCEQERIVSILQKFDTIGNDEHSGIPAEIATRRRQYEFYRDSLLTFDRIGENV